MNSEADTVKLFRTISADLNGVAHVLAEIAADRRSAQELRFLAYHLSELPQKWLRAATGEAAQPFN